MNIRKMKFEDKSEILSMMKIFYSSELVFTNGSDEIFNTDFETCINNSPYLDGYVFTQDETIMGYAMIAKSFSTEFGRQCIWIEDLYIKDKYRGTGIGSMFMEFITKKYTDCIFRLEVEEENERAIKVYEKSGFTVLPYMEMKR